jgi:cell wall-associated NlpC family hydrolase
MVSSACLVAGVLAAGPTATAKTPGAKAKDVKAQIQTAHQELASLNSQAEIAAERYNAARIQLATAQQTAQAAQGRLTSAQAKLTKLQKSVVQFSVAAYQGTSPTSMLNLFDGTSGQMVDRVSSMEAIATTQSRALAGVDAAQRSEEQAQADATAAVANQRKLTAQLASAKQQIVAAAAKQRTILRHLEARERALIKAAKRRAARIAAARRAARLRAQRLAAARAARAVASQPVSQPAPQPARHVPSAGGAATAVAWAYREIGKPYVWGAAGPNSFDCSGLAQYVWGKAGVYLAHYTGDQWNEGTHIARADVQPGDLVFFATNTSSPSTIHHVGIYVGGGQMIDAPYTGAYVRKEYAFRSDYIGAVRPG